MPNPDDIFEGSFMEFVANESYVSPSDRAWERFVRKVEKILGRAIDGEEVPGDGLCLDLAYDAFEHGDTPEQYVAAARAGEYSSVAQ